MAVNSLVIKLVVARVPVLEITVRSHLLHLSLAFHQLSASAAQQAPMCSLCFLLCCVVHQCFLSAPLSPVHSHAPTLLCSSMQILLMQIQCDQASATLSCLTNSMRMHMRMHQPSTGHDCVCAHVQVARGMFCWSLTVTIGRLQGFSRLYGQRRNYLPLFIRGVTGAASMVAYYFGLQFLPLGDTVRTATPASRSLCWAWALLMGHVEHDVLLQAARKSALSSTRWKVMLLLAASPASCLPSHTCMSQMCTHSVACPCAFCETGIYRHRCHAPRPRGLAPTLNLTFFPHVSCQPIHPIALLLPTQILLLFS